MENVKIILDADVLIHFAYCEKEKISYLTTIDFLYYAYLGKLMSADECNEFIEVVNNKGSKLPNIDITKYKPNTIL